jgi:hypothetical protein
MRIRNGDFVQLPETENPCVGGSMEFTPPQAGSLSTKRRHQSTVAPFFFPTFRILLSTFVSTL